MTPAEIAEANMALVPFIVRRHCMGSVHSGYSFDDAVAAGMIGLMRGAERYDASLGKLAPHLAWWIRKEVGRDARSFHGVDYRRSTDKGVRWVGAPRSLDAPIDPEGTTLHDVVAARPCASPEPPPPLALRALAEVSERDRVALLEDRHLAAELLGISADGADARKRRAHRRLRKAVVAQFEIGPSTEREIG